MVYDGIISNIYGKLRLRSYCLLPLRLSYWIMQKLHV